MICDDYLPLKNLKFSLKCDSNSSNTVLIQAKVSFMYSQLVWLKTLHQLNHLQIWHVNLLRQIKNSLCSLHHKHWQKKVRFFIQLFMINTKACTLKVVFVDLLAKSFLGGDPCGVVGWRSWDIWIFIYLFIFNLWWLEIKY